MLNSTVKICSVIIAKARIVLFDHYAESDRKWLYQSVRITVFQMVDSSYSELGNAINELMEE